MDAAGFLRRRSRARGDARLPAEAGPDLEARIARRVFGNAAHPVLPYSQDDAAADVLVRALEGDVLRCALARFAGTWYAVWWKPSATGRLERLATGSASRRALAICRSVVNLPASAFGAAGRSAAAEAFRGRRSAAV